MSVTRLMMTFVCAWPAVVYGQSSSLWSDGAKEAKNEKSEAPSSSALTAASRIGREEPRGNPVLEKHSFFAVGPPKPKKFKVHDIVTVIINESRRSQSRSQLDQEKDFKVDSSFDQWFRIHDKKLIPNNFSAGKPGVKFDFGTEFEGQGQMRRDERLITRIAAEVVDVKPNGNLIIGASKLINEEGEERILTLTGKCRSADVLPDNTILSTQVASLVIDSEATGALRDASRRGWIPRALDFIRPF